MIWLELLFSTIFVVVYLTKGQLSPHETMRNVTHCDLNVAINLTCGADAVVAVNTLQYAYHVTCETTCCQYSSYHCFVDAETNDIKDARRACSGLNSCNVSIYTRNTDFTTCSLGVKDVSYVFIQYYCIPETRIRSICSTGQPLMSTNLPLYLTNEGYPGVTTGAMVCSCSLEIFSCNSSINLYIADADLYLDTNNCEQKITFSGQGNQTLKTIACEDHYVNRIAKTLLDSHYAKIEFNGSSTQNLQGYFFLGFDSSVPDVLFSLTCSAQPETWCAGCGSVPTIGNGNITLSKEGDDSFGATANVTCDTGYETNTTAISCPENGTWPIPECTIKRCGALQSIKHGNITLNKEGDDTFGAKANVTCDNGYKTNTTEITCPETGTWPDPECSQIRCGRLPTINNGNITLSNASDDSMGATAEVACYTGYETNTTTISCQANGTWPIPVCTRKQCESVPPINNGDIALSNASDDSIGATANVTCDTGYETNTPTISCLENGTWPTPVCTRKRCGSVPTTDNGNITLSDEDDGSFGATAEVTCDTGYETDTPIISCLGNGKWPVPECTRKRCGSVPTIDNGNIKLSNEDDDSFGATANVICDTGYETNTTTITCRANGLWQTPECTRKQCGSLPSFENGHYELTSAADTMFGAIAKVVCDPGYISNKPTIECQPSGRWETAVCSRKVTPEPPTKKEDSGVNETIIIVLAIILPIFLGQLLFMLYLQCRIHRIRKTATNEEAEVHKRILMTILGSIPFVGIIPIYLTWKVFYRDVYKVTRKQEKVNKLNESKAFSNNVYDANE